MSKKKLLQGFMFLLGIAACAEIYFYAVSDTPTTQTATINAHAQHGVPPTLDVNYSLAGDDLKLKLTVSHFNFSLDNMGKDNKHGEGHVHLYVDGKKVAKIFEPEFVYKDVAPGKHQVVVELAHNNHDSYGVKKTFEIDIKK